MAVRIEKHGAVWTVIHDRPEARNAQNRGMLVELNDTFLRAEDDDEVRVVILAGAGKMFSSGHDMGSQVSLEEFMACGVGGCAGCAVPVVTDAGLAMKRVCVDGPVFDANAVFPPAA